MVYRRISDAQRNLAPTNSLLLLVSFVKLVKFRPRSSFKATQSKDKWTWCQLPPY